MIQERKQRLLRLTEQHAFELRNSYVGSQRSVLFEKTEGAANSSGHTDNFLPVVVVGASIQANELLDVIFVENTAEGLVGKVI